MFSNIVDFGFEPIKIEQAGEKVYLNNNEVEIICKDESEADVCKTITDRVINTTACDISFDYLDFYETDAHKKYVFKKVIEANAEKVCLDELKKNIDIHTKKAIILVRGNICIGRCTEIIDTYISNMDMRDCRTVFGFEYNQNFDEDVFCMYQYCEIE